MKKISALSLLLCAALLIQLLGVPVFATGTETSPPTETMASEPENTQPVVIPEVAYGKATISNGCRSLDAQVPLGDDEKILPTAQAAFVYERNTGTVLYSHNEDYTLSPGGLTKILTAIIAIEQTQLDEQVTISTANYTAIAGTLNSNLKHGEVMSMEDLLHCLIMRMANDAAVSIAEYIAGTEAKFVDMMNAMVNEIGCTDTKIVNCHGLEATGQQTTARDMAKILQYAMKNAIFREIFACQSYVVQATNRSEERKLISLNYLMEPTAYTKFNYDGVTGGLATYAANSGASIVCSAEKDGMSMILVLLGAKRTYTGTKVNQYGNYEEMWTLLDYSLNNFKLCRLLHNGQSMKQFSVANGENQVVGMTTTDMDAVLPVKVNLEDLTLKYEVANGGLTAPVEKEEMVSTLQIWYRSSCVAETELYAMSAVRDVENTDLDIQNAASRDDSNLTGVLSFVGVLFLIVLVLALAYLIFVNVRRSIARKRRRRSRRAANARQQASGHSAGRGRSGARRPDDRRRSSSYRDDGRRRSR